MIVKARTIIPSVLPRLFSAALSNNPCCIIPPKSLAAMVRLASGYFEKKSCSLNRHDTIQRNIWLFLRSEDSFFCVRSLIPSFTVISILKSDRKYLLASSRILEFSKPSSGQNFAISSVIVFRLSFSLLEICAMVFISLAACMELKRSETSGTSCSVDGVVFLLGSSFFVRISFSTLW